VATRVEVGGPNDGAMLNKVVVTAGVPWIVVGTMEVIDGDEVAVGVVVVVPVVGALITGPVPTAVDVGVFDVGPTVELGAPGVGPDGGSPVDVD
jgi:hypothetical protein